MLQKQTRSKRRHAIYDSVISDVESGKNLSSSLAKFSHIFGDFIINIVRAGEHGGILHQNLNYLAEELQKRHELKQKVVGSLIYPLFIMLATFLVAGLLVLFIFPKIIPIFKSLNFGLPLSTKILLAVSNFFIAHSLYIFLGVIVLAIAFFIMMKKSITVRRIMSRAVLRIPIIGKIIQLYYITNFCRTLGLLLKSGIRIVEGLSIIAQSTGNVSYREASHSLSKNISTGRKLSLGLEDHKHLFSDVTPQMVAIGEISGNMAETLLYLADMHEHELEDLTKNLSNSIEPVLMIIMGLVVGFIAISVITPIYGITQNLSR